MSYVSPMYSSPAWYSSFLAPSPLVLRISTWLAMGMNTNGTDERNGVLTMSATITETYVSLSVCSCCLMVAANGECCGDGHDGPAPLSLVPESCHVSCGWTQEEYAARGETFPDWENGEDDSRGFSWSDCDGCGALAGDRYPLTYWTR